MSRFTDLLADPYARRRYILECWPFDSRSGEVVERCYSTDGWTSGAGDDPAHTWYAPRIAEPLSVTRALWREGATGGRSQPATGYVLLSNADGRGDEWVHLRLDGRIVVVALGGEGFARADFGTVFFGTAEGVEVTRDAVKILLRDWQFLLDQPLSARRYGGTGGWDGGQDLANRPLPVTFGQADGVEPVTVDRVGRRYQVHDAAIAGIDRVLDDGVPLTPAGDFATVAALDAATVAPGTYATCLAAGVFVTGSEPVGALRCDVRGHAAGGYSATAGGVMAAMAARLEVATDTASLAALDALAPAAVGYHARDAVQAADAMDMVAESVGAWWGFPRSGGALRFGRLDAPGGQPVAEFTPVEVLSFERVAAALPVWRLTLEYRRCWSPLDPLAAGAADADRQFYAAEFRAVEASDAAVLAAHLLAGDETQTTLLVHEADAQAEAVRRFGLYGVDRAIWRVRCKSQPFRLEAGDEVRLRLPRFDVGGGKDFRILSLKEDALFNEVELELWG